MGREYDDRGEGELHSRGGGYKYIYIGRGEAFRGARGGDGGLKGSFSPCVGILSRGCGGVGSEFYR